MGLLLSVSTIQLSFSVTVNVVQDNVPDSLLDQYDQYDDSDNIWQKDQMKKSFDVIKDKARKINTPLHSLDIQTTTDSLHLGSSTNKDDLREKLLPTFSSLKNSQNKKTIPRTTENVIKSFDHQGSVDNYEKILTDDDNYVDNVSKINTKKSTKKAKNTSVAGKKSSDEIKISNKDETRVTKVILLI